MAKEKNTKKNKKSSAGNVNQEKTLKKNMNVNSETDKHVKKKTIEKAKRELHFENSDDANEISKLIKIVLFVTAIMIVFYFVTTIVTKKANAIRTVRNIVNKEKAEIQYDSVIIGSMLKMDGSYYVLIEKEDDDSLSEYKTLLQTISANDEAPKIYTANLSDSFNSIYLGEESNYSSDLTVFKVKGTTLVEISDHEIKNTYDTYDSISNKLGEFK